MDGPDLDVSELDGSELARTVLDTFRDQKLMLATAESCTGGMVAASITDIPGSSAVLDCGFVTYSNNAKAQMLGVDRTMIVTHGAVSAEVAEAMAAGALENSTADIAVAITGIAGPGGGSAAKPEGLVHFACQRRNHAPRLSKQEFGALGRDKVRALATTHALEMALAAAKA